MMVTKSIIRILRIKVLPTQLSKSSINSNDPVNSGSKNNHYGQVTGHLVIIPTPYTLPIVVPIYADEKTIRESTKDYYYVVP
ncbi:hypothetical protein [Vulcanisaeta sp. JCM 16159]|uniref:hypothetical protein n=1 Tax=Vulcanisaeta sp. JCM 16159 TaxID=1295371 RepID=UPI0006CF724D|nr:hypothetical protein [Vulcanisaeta sp. JCM 16159]